MSGTLALALFAACGGASDDAPMAGPETLQLDPPLEVRRGVDLPEGVALERIAFGSCSRTTLPQPLWSPIASANPQVWIWLGDNVYGDSEDVSVLAEKYDAQLSVPGYVDLLGRAAVVGTWDDHDYGANNAGREYPSRAQSQQALLDFLGEPEDSPRRAREGVYAAYTWGPPGRRVKVVLLDARYHRDARGSDGAVLGEAQWAWLEQELSSSDAQVHLIASGVQVLHEDHEYERWSEFPTERVRLFELIARTGVPGVVLLSGDRHISEIARLPAGVVDYPLWEVTSSGMTHSWSDNPGEPNRHRVGGLYTGLGFGTIDVDWERGTLALQLRDPQNTVVQEQVVALAELRRGA
jgi:alkaline phosphatase D